MELGSKLAMICFSSGNTHSNMGPERQMSLLYLFVDIILVSSGMCLSFGISIEVMKLLIDHRGELSREGR